MGEDRFEVRVTPGFFNGTYSLWDAQRRVEVMPCRSEQEAKELAAGFNAAWDKRQEAERQAAVRAAFDAYMSRI